MLKTFLIFVASGLGTLAAVNIASMFTGVKIAINLWTVLSSAIFGIPGVFGLLTVRMYF